MTALPARTNGTTGIVDAVTNLQQKSNLGDLRDFLAGLLGTDGVVATARTALDVPQTTAAILKAIVTTKGDIVAATGAGLPVRLGVGSEGQVPVARAAAATGIAWEAPASGGGGTIIPVGTRMLFQQTAAPTGFTKVTGAAFNNKALRIVTGTVGSGGATGFSSVFGSGKTAGGTALSIANLPSGNIGSFSVTSGGRSAQHTHVFNDYYQSTVVSGTAQVPSLGADQTVISAIAEVGANTPNSVNGEGEEHTHAVSGSVASAGGGTTHNHTLSLDLAYHDVIAAVKD